MTQPEVESGVVIEMLNNWPRTQVTQPEVENGMLMEMLAARTDLEQCTIRAR